MSAENDNKPLEEVKPEAKAEETQEVCPNKTSAHQQSRDGNGPLLLYSRPDAVWSVAWLIPVFVSRLGSRSRCCRGG
jgi:hypothetical protein